MSWQYRVRSPEDEATNTLSGYQAGLRAADARGRLEVNLDSEAPAVSRFNAQRLRNVAFLWTIIVLAIAVAATWFLDRVLAAETVAIVTAIVIVTTRARLRRT
jgi:hypothetical protein